MSRSWSMCERSQFELQLFADNKQRPVEVYWYMPSLQDFQCMLKYHPELSEPSQTPLRLLHVCYSPEKSLEEYVLIPEMDINNHFVPIIKFTRVEKEESNSKVVLEIHDWLEDRMIPIMRLLNDDKGDYIWKKKNQVSPHTKSDLKSRLETIEKEERNLRQLELEGASQEDIQHKQENIGVHFKAIWNMLTAVASITGVPLDTSNKPEVVIPTHKQSEDDDSLPTKGTYDDYRDVNKIDEKPVHMYQFIDRVPHELLEDVSAITDHSTRQACPSRTFDQHPTSSCRQCNVELLIIARGCQCNY